MSNKANVLSKIFRKKRAARELLVQKQQSYIKQFKKAGEEKQDSSSSIEPTTPIIKKPLMLKLPNHTRWLGQLECWNRLIELIPFVRDALNELKNRP